MYEIYEKKINSDFAGGGVESIIVNRDGVIVAHLRGWDNPNIVDDTFKPVLKGKLVDRRGRGWRKLTGEALLNAQSWAEDVVN